VPTGLCAVSEPIRGSRSRAAMPGVRILVTGRIKTEVTPNFIVAARTWTNVCELKPNEDRPHTMIGSPLRTPTTIDVSANPFDGRNLVSSQSIRLADCVVDITGLNDSHANEADPERPRDEWVGCTGACCRP
jgi:hypothetical protein